MAFLFVVFAGALIIFARWIFAGGGLRLGSITFWLLVILRFGCIRNSHKGVSIVPYACTRWTSRSLITKN
jgi:hypothetical protein